MRYTEVLWSFLALSIFAATALAQNATKGGREGKILSVFNIVNFPNDVCQGSNNQNGTCYTAAECSSKGGSNTGSCAQGYGVCCVFSLRCGQNIAENCTYFQSSGNEAGSCKVKICPCNDNICQLRLDFSTFLIAGPSTSTVSVGMTLNGAPAKTGKTYSTATQCNTDTFSVTSPGNPTPPTICGTNTGEHMYVEASKCDCNILNFNIDSATTTTRQWNIKITQYSCDYSNLAPEGCTKYYFGGTGDGQLQTYNFDGGLHLADQTDRMCVRRERGNCRICYTITATTDFQLTFSAALVAGMAGATGMKQECCGYGEDGMSNKGGYDCLIIPGAQPADTAANPPYLKGDEFCGKSSLVKSAGMPGTICSKKQPFMVTFNSDNNEQTMTKAEAAASGAGFKLTYLQTAC